MQILYKLRTKIGILFEWDYRSHFSNEFEILKNLIRSSNHKDMHVLSWDKNLRYAYMKFWAILWILFNLSLKLENLVEWDCRSNYSNEFEMLKNLIWIWDEGDIALGSWVRKFGNALKCKAGIWPLLWFLTYNLKRIWGKFQLQCCFIL